MPWDAKRYKKRNRGLTVRESGYAAKIANAILEASGDEGKAVRIANSKVKSKKGRRVSVK